MNRQPLFVASLLVIGCTSTSSEPAARTEEASAPIEASTPIEAAAPAEVVTPTETPPKPDVPVVDRGPRLVLGWGMAMLAEDGQLTHRGPVEVRSWLAKQGKIEDVWLGSVVCAQTASGFTCKPEDGKTPPRLPTEAPVIDLEWSYESLYVLTSDGALWFGIGRDPGSQPLQRFPISGVVVDIDVRDNFGCARLEDRSAQCWQGKDAAAVPAPSESFSNTRDIAVGSQYMCILDEHGTPRCRDDAEYREARIGELGKFVAIEGMPPLIEIAGGLRHVCGRSESDEIWCWGSNEHGQLGDGTTRSQQTSTPVRVGSFAKLEQLVVQSDESCVLADGQVQCWGWATHTPADSVPTEIPGIVASELDIGEMTACARVDTGWKCWGGLSDDIGGMTDIVDIVDSTRTEEFGDGCSFTAGRLRCGDDEEVWLDVRGVVDVVRTSDPLCFLRRERVECRYSFDSGEPVLSLRVPPSVSLDGDSFHGCVVTKTGEVHCWASEEGPVTRIELPGKQVAVRVGLIDDACALDEAGTVHCWSDVQPVVAAALSDVVELHGGHGFGCARDRAGALACWGKYLIADADETSVPTPDKPLALKLPAPVVEFGVGEDYGCARLDDGRVFCFGAEMYGQRARLSTEFVLRPQVIRFD